MAPAGPEPGPTAGPRRGERERIRRLYEDTYTGEKYRRLWSGPGAEAIHRFKWADLRPVLAVLGLPRPHARVLDLGARTGEDCEELERLGWERAGIVALDLVARDLRAARERLPWLSAVVADASRLPVADSSVDLVFQSMMVSSVLDPGTRGVLYAEMTRVVKRGGVVLSYDLRYPNPWNRNTRPVTVEELRRAFPGWPLRVRSLTLLPPLVRRLAPISAELCRALERLPFLRSHLLACAVKP